MRLTTCSRASSRRDERSSRANGTPTPTPSAAATISKPHTANHCLQSSSNTTVSYEYIYLYIIKILPRGKESTEVQKLSSDATFVMCSYGIALF